MGRIVGGARYISIHDSWLSLFCVFLLDSLNTLTVKVGAKILQSKSVQLILNYSKLQITQNLLNTQGNYINTKGYILNKLIADRLVV